MERIVFFPFHPDMELLLDSSLTREYIVWGVVSFKEDWENVAAINKRLGREPVDELCLLEECDILCMLDNDRNFRTEKYYKILDCAIANKKEILISPKLVRELDLEGYRGEYQILENTLQFGVTLHRLNRIQYINVPIIGIFGLGKNCGKFEELMTVENILAKELRANMVLCIASNPLGALKGYYTWPEFFYAEASFDKKVRWMNRYVYDLYEKLHPSLIVLEVPEGIAPFQSHEYNHFAEYGLVLSSALEIDAAIVCTYHMAGQIMQSGIDAITDYFEGKFNIHCCGIAISSVCFDLPQEITEDIIYEKLDHNYIRKHFPEYSGNGIPVFCISDWGQNQTVISGLIQELYGNANIV